MESLPIYRHHLDSFNWLVDQATYDFLGHFRKSISVVSRMRQRKDSDSEENSDDELESEALYDEIFEIDLKLNEISLAKPTIQLSPSSSVPLFPHICRKQRISYHGVMTLKWHVELRSAKQAPQTFQFETHGDFPVMVRSNRCNLTGKTEQELIKLNEDPWGPAGFFLSNGRECLVRAYIMKKQFQSESLKGKKGTIVTFNYSGSDQELLSLALFYYGDGNVLFQSRAYVPYQTNLSNLSAPAAAILKALIPTTDQYIFERITMGLTSPGLAGLVEDFLRDSKRRNLRSQTECLEFIGRYLLKNHTSMGLLTPVDAGNAFLKTFLQFCKTNEEKFSVLASLLQKLFLVESGNLPYDNRDDPSQTDLLLPGQLLANQLKMGLKFLMSKNFPVGILQHLRAKPYFDRGMFLTSLERTTLFKRIHNLMATGNAEAMRGLPKESSGFVVTAENISFSRYLSHFVSIHKGSSRMEDKVVAPRKLHPSGWGFICPVHTPDGLPCGLLLHLTAECRLYCKGQASQNEEEDLVIRQLLSFGMEPLHLCDFKTKSAQLLVTLNGIPRGLILAQSAPVLERSLRLLKVKGKLPSHMEIILIELSNPTQVPGLFLFTNLGRMVRPVWNLQAQAQEWIGIGEQPFLNIALTENDVKEGFTHQELSSSSIFSVLALQTPFCDHNQSPRNIYQCQMAKQTMGSPLYSLSHRLDNKAYRLQTPQRPLVTTQAEKQFKLDEYPSVTNAVVAVLSYTGFDMEDAMIINKGSMERGFMHGFVYKTAEIDLLKQANPIEATPYFTAIPPNSASDAESEFPPLDIDGLPPTGLRLKHGDLWYSYWDGTKLVPVRWKDREPCVVDSVLLVPRANQQNSNCSRVFFKYRLDRRPVWGDKFSSRHGQKGTLSQLWPHEDMPFTESGVVPDIIINPHAFPSRMTIGMLIESLAGKAGALHGFFQDGSAFSRGPEDLSPLQLFGEQLVAAGFNYHGNEPLISGVTGEPLQADIFIGVVAYQRLRHMIKDKSQAREKGPITYMTRQPVKGRKRGGGLRLGEMERDALLSHGASAVLHERFMPASDATFVHLCEGCHSFLTTYVVYPKIRPNSPVFCNFCKDKNPPPSMKLLQLPFAFINLAHELASVGIRLSFHLKEQKF